MLRSTISKTFAHLYENVPGLSTFFRTTTLSETVIREQCDYKTITRAAKGIAVFSIPRTSTPCGTSSRFTNTIEQIKEHYISNGDGELGMVISVTEEDELKGTGYLGYKFVQPSDWKAAGVEHRRINIKDYELLPVVSIEDKEHAARVLLEAKKMREAGKSIGIHCKAGKRRSAMTTVDLIVLCDNLSFDEVNQGLKKKRKQLNVKGSVRTLGLEILDIARQMEKGVYVRKAIPVQHSNPSSFWRYKTAVGMAITAGAVVTLASRMMG